MKNGLMVIILALVVIFCSFDRCAGGEIWWREVQCVTPKVPTNLYGRASENSDVLAQVYPGNKLRVTYGKIKLVLVENGKLGEERWYEISLFKREDGPVYGWIKADEVKECEEEFKK